MILQANKVSSEIIFFLEISSSSLERTDSTCSNFILPRIHFSKSLVWSISTHIHTHNNRTNSNSSSNFSSRYANHTLIPGWSTSFVHQRPTFLPFICKKKNPGFPVVFVVVGAVVVVCLLLVDVETDKTKSLATCATPRGGVAWTLSICVCVFAPNKLVNGIRVYICFLSLFLVFNFFRLCHFILALLLLLVLYTFAQVVCSCPGVCVEGHFPTPLHFSHPANSHASAVYCRT